MHGEGNFGSSETFGDRFIMSGERQLPEQREPFVNRKELRVIGMSRSGNHAIINWILQQAGGRTCFLNCVEGKTNPFHSARALHGDLPYVVNYADFTWEREQAGHFSPKDLLIYSYEDSFLGHICHPLFEENHDRWVGRSQVRHDILILRDPFNLFASRRRATHLAESVPVLVAMRIWRQHAREFLGDTRYLRQPSILINYNLWATDRCYRQTLAMRLGLTFTDAGINTVPPTAGGSSFDGVRYDGAATKMKVIERWKAYQHDAEYRQTFQRELVDYSRRLFGPIPGIASLFKDESATTHPSDIAHAAGG